MSLANKEIYQNGAIREFEKPEVCEAIKVANENRWTVCLSPIEWDEREARLKKEYEQNTKSLGPGEEQPKEGDLKAATKMFGAQAREIMRLTAENAELRETIDKMKEGNPALKEALNESASQFNDALLDEQAKKIEKLANENERLKDQIARLNKIIHKKNLKIEELGKESSRHLRGKMKMFGENFDLEQELKDKNAVLSDVADELRLSKIREKNLTEVSQKYMKENEELKKELADKVVDKIGAQALKSAESALAYKEKVIADLTKKLKSINKNRHNERIYKKQLAEKDEVIAELDKELDEANKHQQQAYRSCADKNKEIRALKLQISALEKRGNGIDWKRNADAIKLYVNRASHERLWSPISQDICNEQELSFIINHGGKRVKYALRFDGTDIVYECSDPDKKPSFFRDDSVGAVTNQKDCSPVKDTHSTEDNPEEIEIEKAVKLVRKAMKEGRTVTIDYKD